VSRPILSRWLLGFGFFLLPVAALLLLILLDALQVRMPARLLEVGPPQAREWVMPQSAFWRFGWGAQVFVQRGQADGVGAEFRWVERGELESASAPEALVRVRRFDASALFGIPVEVCDGAGCTAWRNQPLTADARLHLDLADGRQMVLSGTDIAALDTLNRDGTFKRLGHWLRALAGVVIDAPRNANTEGGMGPALVGTSLLVLLMSAIVSPLGVFAAIYLYMNQDRGGFARLARAAISNLAAVPSVLYGAFVMVAFVYGLGGFIDQTFFAHRLPSPTFGTGGLLWAACAMALLTLPIVVTVTLEGLERVPQGLIEASLALGATREETLIRLVLPLARGAFLTGLILAISRAAGEVAPLMLVGVVKSAPQLPLSPDYPYIHLEQKFMHLGHQLYDLAVHAPSFEAALPMLKVCAALLLVIVLSLNLIAFALRARLIRGMENMLP